MSIFGKPQYSTVTVSKKKDIPKNLYLRCPVCGEMVYVKELEKNLNVVPQSGYHFPLEAKRRIDSLVDQGSFKEYDAHLEPVDVLKFNDVRSYEDRLKSSQEKTGEKDAVICGDGKIGNIDISLSVMDFRFLAASMGAVVGEKITRTIERAIEQKNPLIIVCASGGARMQEGVYSLMQMAKTSAALGRLNAAKLPFISILTHPTTGGVTASFAVLGDIILAEPGALIGFAGPRVIKETIKRDLPDGFQTAEFLLQKGLIDQIVPRHELRERLIMLLQGLYLGKKASKTPS